MKKIFYTMLIISSFIMANNVWASSETRAINLCKDKIKSIYAVDRFKHVEADKTGHNKYDVHGKVKYDGEKRPFSCRVKNERLRSYHYEGRHKRHKDDDHKSHTGRNVAIGVGIAAIAAMVIKNKHNKNDDEYSKHVTKESLEDDCHDELSRRIKDNYHSIRRVEFKHDSIKHNMRKGEGDGRIIYRNGERTDFEFTCYFEKDGQISDSSYSIF